MPKRTGLTERAIAERALAMVDAAGLDGLSMRKLAAALGVSPMTLYAYFADRDALLEAAAQLLYAQMEVPPENLAPRKTLHAIMHSVRDILLAHPNTLPLLTIYPPRTLDALAFVNAGYRALRLAGVAPLDTARCYRALAAYSLGTAAVEINRYFTDAPVTRPAGTLDEATIARHLPYLAEVGPHLADLDDLAEFDYGLDLTLDGFLHRHRIEEDR